MIKTIVEQTLIHPKGPPKQSLGRYSICRKENIIATPIGAVNPIFSKCKIFKKQCPVPSDNRSRMIANDIACNIALLLYFILPFNQNAEKNL